MYISKLILKAKIPISKTSKICQKSTAKTKTYCLIYMKNQVSISFHLSSEIAKNVAELSGDFDKNKSRQRCSRIAKMATNVWKLVIIMS